MSLNTFPIYFFICLFLTFLSGRTLAFDSKYAGKVNEVTSGTAWHFLQPTGIEQGELVFLCTVFYTPCNSIRCQGYIQLR